MSEVSSLLSRIFDYFTSSKESVGKKLGNFLLAIFIIFLFDTMFNISNGLHQSSVLSKLKGIKELKTQYVNNQIVIDYLDDLESSVIEKQHPYDYFLSLTSSFPSLLNNTQSSAEIQKIPHTSIIFTALSSSTLFILFALGAITSPFWSGNYSLKNIRESISIAMVLSALVTILTFILNLIPVIIHPLLNYILYLIFQVIIIYMFVKIFNKWESIKKRKQGV